jgi:hypothetical protein
MEGLCGQISTDERGLEELGKIGEVTTELMRPSGGSIWTRGLLIVKCVS